MVGVAPLGGGAGGFHTFCSGTCLLGPEWFRRSVAVSRGGVLLFARKELPSSRIASPIETGSTVLRAASLARVERILSWIFVTAPRRSSWALLTDVRSSSPSWLTNASGFSGNRLKHPARTIRLGDGVHSRLAHWPPCGDEGWCERGAVVQRTSSERDRARTRP